MRHPRRLLGSRSQLGAAVALIGLLVLSPLVPTMASGGPEADPEVLGPGVEHLRLRRGGRLVADVARLRRDAPARLVAVLASDRIASTSPGREIVSATCRRVGGTVCVNADFASCPACREAFGGFATGGSVRRSFHPHHEQFSVTPQGYSLERLSWRAELRATYRWPAQESSTDRPAVEPTALEPQEDEPAPAPTPAREEVRTLPIERLNRQADEGSEALTVDWGGSTRPADGRLELILHGDESTVAGAHDVVLAGRRDAGPVPGPGEVVVRGPSDALGTFWDEWHASDAPGRSLTLDVVVAPVVESVGGHPVLLAGGHRAKLDPTDSKVSGRHPRTLVAWTAAGDLLLVTIDGRQPGWSAGATLAEATDLLLSLGATDALNLDGGGSSTFVAPCDPGRLCVRNRPSDGQERAVPVVLAVVVDDEAAARHRDAGRAAAATAPAVLVAPPAAQPAVTEPPPAPVTTEPAPAPAPSAEPTPPEAPAAPEPEALPDPPPPPTSPPVSATGEHVRPGAIADVVMASTDPIGRRGTRLGGREAGLPAPPVALAVFALSVVALATVRSARRSGWSGRLPPTAGGRRR